jgi:hypothetical protein
MEGEMLKGHLDMIVLAAGPAHGYAVIEEINRRSNQASIFRRVQSIPPCIVSNWLDCFRAVGSPQIQADGGGSIH